MASNLIFTTPSDVIQCGVAHLLWGGGTPPYAVTVLDGQTLGGSVLEQVGHGIFGVQATWKVDWPANTQLIFEVLDSNSQTAQTTLVSVAPSDDSSCLQGGGSSSSDSPNPTTTSGTHGKDQTSSPTSTFSTSTAISSSVSKYPQTNNATTSAVTAPSNTSQSSNLPSATSDPSIVSNPPSTKSGPSMGLVAGVVGALLLLVAIGFAFYYYRHRRRQAQMFDDLVDDGIPITETTSRQWQDRSEIALSDINQSTYSFPSMGGGVSTNARPIYNDSKTSHMVPDGSASQLSLMPVASSASRANLNPGPSTLSPEEMGALADLVASRLQRNNNAYDVDEPPPQYQAD